MVILNNQLFQGSLIFVLVLTFSLNALSQDGELDSLFGDDGKILFPIGQHLYTSDIAVQADGKIIVFGTSENLYENSINPFVVRFSQQGELDVSFGIGGIFVPSSTSDFGDMCSGQIQPGGRIIGSSINFDYWGLDSICLFRLNDNGSLDSTFGLNGFKCFDNYDYCPRIDFQDSGIIVTFFDSYEKIIYRLNFNGSDDISFGIDGKQDFDNLFVGGYWGDQTEIAVQQDGKILLCSLSSGKIWLARLNSDGTIDESFGDNGIIKIDSEYLKDVVIQPDGRIVIISSTSDIYTFHRFEPDGTKISEVSNNLSGNDYLGTFIVQNDGKILAGGEVGNDYSYSYETDFALWRFNQDGTLDQSFGSNGKVITPIGVFTQEEFGGVGLYEDKIFLAGSSAEYQQQVALLRFENPSQAEVSTFQSEENTIELYCSPNPFKTQTSVNFSIEHSEWVTLGVYDFSGHHIINLIDEKLPAGSHERQLDARGLPCGIYLIRLRAGTKEQTRKCVLSK